ncbi:LPS assembly lipoprotein LptE [Legionella sp.]|uniref:LPS-assembly lipoprotein LptE n=1 Tax=Legionella sp. TaxID=459 RepID=UPI003CBA4FA2
MKKLFLPLMIILLLSACGFHLRGKITAPLWLNNVAIVTKINDKQFISLLTTQLEEYSIQVNPDLALAKYWLIINQSVIERQIVSIGASTNPRQYTLTLTIEFMLQTYKGKIIKTPRKVRATRQLTINNDRILGSSDEENILIGEMKQDAVIQIINQLNHRDKEL